ncbi:MAG TPA: hypothetical protein VK900_15590 [Anaerolineales bacterium]|nr:hypothetical protein [Anaerolineales bacterium]
MLSYLSRGFTYVLAFLYAVLGFLLFFFHAQLAPVFAWKVTPFMAMTIGGWCLGNAWLARITARRWRWSLVFSALIYLWLFGLGELLVLFLFRDRLVLSHPIAWLYLTTLIGNALAAVVGIVDWFRLRPTLDSTYPEFTPWQWAATLAFILFAGFLGVYGLFAPMGAPGTNGGIFPEVMSPFTLRSFGMFYLTLALGVVPFLWHRNLNAILHHAFASYGFIVFITAAAFVYIGLFDFVIRPGGLLYFAAYLAVGIPLILIFRRQGTGAPA